MNYLLLLLIIFPHKSYSQVLHLESNYWKKIKEFTWNGTTPLAIDPIIAKEYNLSSIINNKEIPFIKSLETNFEIISYVFRPSIPLTLDNNTKYFLYIKKGNNTWPFIKSKIKFTTHITKPKLELLTISPTITHGGTGIITFESEKKENLSFLALIDERKVSYYPQTLVKDGFYILLFSWYSDYSNNLSNQYLLSIDKSGNITRLPINTKSILRNHKKRIINLPNNYTQQKAKELSLTKKEAEEIEGNIEAINSVLSKQKSISRWFLTRTNFQDSINQTISNPLFFSLPSNPMKKYITTSKYGEQRKYYYKKKIVRTSVHRGLDFASYKNSPLYALLDGTVAYADWNGGYGNNIIIDHGLGVFTSYAHAKKLLVKQGDKIKSGQLIAISGSTGQSTGDHLHLSLIIQGMYVEPKEWLSENFINKNIHIPIKKAIAIINQKD